MNNSGSATPEEIAAIGVFAGLPSDALQDLARAASRRPLRAGELVFRQGDRPARFHALLSGWVRIQQAGTDGELSVIRFVGPGELFGSFAMFAGDGYPADASAAGEAVELSWTEAQIRKLMARHSEVAVNLVTVAARRLAELQERLREISTQPAEQRIANALLRLAQKAGQQAANGQVDIVLPFVRKDLAAMSATTFYTASRVMSGWQRKGIAVTSGRRVSILAPAELRRIAEGC